MKNAENNAQFVSYVWVGSTNLVKVEAARRSAISIWPTCKVSGVKVPSNVSSQPMTDAETREGASNRARAAWEVGVNSQKLKKRDTSALIQIGCGLEGGIFFDEKDTMWSTVWAAVWDGSQLKEANGARLLVPQPLARLIRQGMEMGLAMDQLTGMQDVKHGSGMIGIITKGVVNRTIEYANLAKLVFGLWVGQNWYCERPERKHDKHLVDDLLVSRHNQPETDQ